MIDESLLSILACPETKKNLVLVQQNIIDLVNAAITEGKILNQLKQKVEEKVDGGLFRENDHCYMYPIRNGIPLLLVEELMDIKSVTAP